MGRGKEGDRDGEREKGREGERKARALDQLLGYPDHQSHLGFHPTGPFHWDS